MAGVLTPTPYAVLADLPNYGITTAAIGTLPVGTQQAQLDSANAFADGYLNDQFVLPLLSWGRDLVEAVCVVAGYKLIAIRGFDPEDEGDKVFLLRYQNAHAWLKAVSKGEVKPTLVDSSSGGLVGGATVLQSSTQTTSQPTLSGPQTLNSNGTVMTGPPSLRGWK